MNEVERNPKRDLPTWKRYPPKKWAPFPHFHPFLQWVRMNGKVQSRLVKKLGITRQAFYMHMTYQREPSMSLALEYSALTDFTVSPLAFVVHARKDKGLWQGWLNRNKPKKHVNGSDLL